MAAPPTLSLTLSATPTLTPTPLPTGAVAYQFPQGVAGYGGATDAQIWRYGPNANYGSSATAWVCAVSCTGGVCLDDYSTVLRFDLSSLAPGAYPLLRTWAESSVTWNAP
ncbi:MAG: hypothetical protein AUK03_08155 [Anaerolineae bacterium CG2_30_64_16]|nr:MAG: hypothetical protein AUK03_08155 [Anaerolineae bacterium CG2_30_64_16]